MTYAELKDELRRLIAEGRLPSRPTREQRIDFVYGNIGIENPDVTLEMATRAVDKAIAAENAK